MGEVERALRPSPHSCTAHVAPRSLGTTGFHQQNPLSLLGSGGEAAAYRWLKQRQHKSPEQQVPRGVAPGVMRSYLKETGQGTLRNPRADGVPGVVFRLRRQHLPCARRRPCAGVYRAAQSLRGSHFPTWTAAWPAGPCDQTLGKQKNPPATLPLRNSRHGRPASMAHYLLSW